MPNNMFVHCPMFHFRTDALDSVGLYDANPSSTNIQGVQYPVYVILVYIILINAHLIGGTIVIKECIKHYCIYSTYMCVSCIKGVNKRMHDC